jgi:predicted RNA-binding protein YlqC (UPF0109 family)
MMAEEHTSEEKALRAIIEMLVDVPGDVRLEATVTNHSAVFDIHVADADVGKVLGKKGVHAHALRTLFGAIYGKLGKRLHLQVVDPRRV